ncbi:hypothetical protein B2J93_4765 [Marssonina coronariae]|uniref:RNA helicase n=1 Tax=Diplocarpon coronariae TaxID=2795749 RepID=A0A218Z3U2_9HELO|nr:hypothetical protein B2J93_4765 [Marssonina coronariae]
MGKFVPRQRKHKAKERGRRDIESAASQIIDSNATEIIPASQKEREKKQRMKEAQQQHGPKISGKKAKRLEKYLETKLKKDENRELIAKLARVTTDTSLYQSSSRLGQGRETKRQRLERALREERAGIDIDGQNGELLFEKRAVKDAAELEENDEDEKIEVSKEGEGPIKKPVSIPIQPKQFVTTLGAGLKRPLELDEEGKPVLKKRKRRGGVNSKLSFKHKASEESEWAGFSSVSEMDTESDTSIQGYEDISDASDVEGLDQDSSSDFDSRSGRSESEETGTFSSGSEDEKSTKPERSSAFKAWATQQVNEALGFQPTPNISNVLEIPKVAGFKPRAPEQDPLPLELQKTTNDSRKAYSVTVARTPGIRDARLKLPVVAEEQKIMEAIHNNNLVVIYGATGSGKTTQVPQFLYEAGYGSKGSSTPGMIGVTQPRRVAAVSMAKRVADELGDHGKRVAYQIRFEGTTGADTAVKFMTDGVLLREVAQDIALRKYSAIIIDEAHERTVNTDILIGMLSRVVKLREELAIEDASIKPLKLIIMSATLRVTDFTQNSTLFSTPPPVLQAEGRQYPVVNHFARKTHLNYVEDAFRKISRGHKKLPPGGFLVFLTGLSEITQLTKMLKEAFKIGHTATRPLVRISGRDAPIEAEDVDFGDTIENSKDDYDEDDDVDINLDDEEFNIEEEPDTGPTKMHILPLYSLLPTKEQLKVFEPPPDGSRLIILATNVAETSITIPGIRFVFDSGRSKEKKYDRITGVQTYEVGWISKASASQRAGRAGRTGPGHCYRLYSSAVYERDFPEFAEPEILRSPIEGVVLQLKAMNLQHVVNFPFPTPPDRQSLASSEKLLAYLSALSPTGQITPTGSTMTIFPVAPRFARILLVGHLHDCLPYTIALVAGLSAPDFFMAENQVVPAAAVRDEDSYFTSADRLEEDRHNAVRRQFNKVHRDFCFLDDKSDAIKLLQVVGEFAHEPTEAWCKAHFVHFKVLKEIMQLQKQITVLLRDNIAAFAGLKFQDKLDPPTVKQVKALKQMVAAGFIDHIAMRADLSPNPPETRRKPGRAIDVPYLTLSPSHIERDDGEKAVYIHPSSPLAHVSPQECPEYIVYSYLQRAAPAAARPEKIPKTRMHALTDITGGQLAALAKGTPLLHYGKPLKEVMPTMKNENNANVRECWVIPYLRAAGTGSIGWPLPARKKGIGRATAISFSLEGCPQIAICDKNRDGLLKTEKYMKEVSAQAEILVCPVDMLEEEQVWGMVQKCVAAWGRLDYAVNAAGIIGNNERSTSTSANDFDLITNINHRGTWLSSRAELTQMLKQEPLPTHDGRQGNRGSIVNVASQLGIVSRPKAPAYCASKAAVISLTKSDAIDYSKDDIRINCVCPGVIATPMTQGDPVFARALEPAIAAAPMGRMGSAQEVADACLFLCSSKATFVQGHALVVDGGLLDSTTTTAALATSYLVSLWSSVLLYRAFFHRLCSFSKPPGAELPKVGHVLQLGNCNNCRRLQRWHAKYGDYERTGPAKLSIVDPDAVNAIMGARSSRKKLA